MSDELEFRKVGDRIITEKQYQSEQNTQQLLSAAGSFSLLTLPASWVSGLLVFGYLMFNAWGDIDSTFGLLFSIFLNGLLAFIVAFAVYMFLIPALFLGAIILICLFADNLFFSSPKQSSILAPTHIASQSKNYFSNTSCIYCYELVADV